MQMIRHRKPQIETGIDALMGRAIVARMEAIRHFIIPFIVILRHRELKSVTNLLDEYKVLTTLSACS